MGSDKLRHRKRLMLHPKAAQHKIGTAQHLPPEETVSEQYTKNITAPVDGMLSFDLSRDDTAIGKPNTKATISSDGLVAPGNGTHIYFSPQFQAEGTHYSICKCEYAIRCIIECGPRATVQRFLQE